MWAGDTAGRGRRCLSPPLLSLPLLSLPSSVRVWPCLLIQAPNLGSTARCGRPWVVGRGQWVPTFKEDICCSDQPGQGAAQDTVGPYECPSNKPEVPA